MPVSRPLRGASTRDGECSSWSLALGQDRFVLRVHVIGQRSDVEEPFRLLPRLPSRELERV